MRAGRVESRFGGQDLGRGRKSCGFSPWNERSNGRSRDKEDGIVVKEWSSEGVCMSGGWLAKGSLATRLY